MYGFQQEDICTMAVVIVDLHPWVSASCPEVLLVIFFVLETSHESRAG
jgi:hypothetical protein